MADDVLINFLKTNGFEDVAAEWNRLESETGFWYA